MRNDIHPAYGEIKATCSCGATYTTKSTVGKDIHLDVCSSCHPFYTGKQKIIDTAGRIERFQKKFGFVNKNKNAADDKSEQKAD